MIVRSNPSVPTKTTCTRSAIITRRKLILNQKTRPIPRPKKATPINEADTTREVVVDTKLQITTDMKPLNTGSTVVEEAAEEVAATTMTAIKSNRKTKILNTPAPKRWSTRE